ncbi:hypothetical protein ACLB1G_15880 [Oxalobacteraceae bacterium A2-2]
MEIALKSSLPEIVSSVILILGGIIITFLTSYDAELRGMHVFYWAYLLIFFTLLLCTHLLILVFIKSKTFAWCVVAGLFGSIIVAPLAYIFSVWFDIFHLGHELANKNNVRLVDLILVSLGYSFFAMHSWMYSLSHGFVIFIYKFVRKDKNGCR